jgi:hypothetical protein
MFNLLLSPTNSDTSQADDVGIPGIVVKDVDSERLGEPDDNVPNTNFTDELEDEQLTSNGFGEVNKSTTGTEFYGPTATLAFLLELRSRARSFQSQINELKAHPPTGNFRPNGARKMSVVNFFHNIDNDVSEKLPLIDESHEKGGLDRSLLHGPASSATYVVSNYPTPNHDVEQECIKLFFANLLLIYYFLDKNKFVESCKILIWSPDQIISESRPPQNL